MFLKVDKELFNMGLDATEILIMAQIMEFETNTGDCFISNEALASQFGVSVDTIKRRLTKLEKAGLIIRETKANQKGKERHIKTNLPKEKKVDEEFAKSKMHLAESANCTLRKVQNAPIKDNNKKINKKDNIQEDDFAKAKHLPKDGAQVKESNRKKALELCWDDNGKFVF